MRACVQANQKPLLISSPSAAPLVVYPFEQERFLTGDSGIVYDQALVDRARNRAQEDGAYDTQTVAHTTGAFGRVCLFIAAMVLAGVLPRVVALLVCRTAKVVPLNARTPDLFPQMYASCSADGSVYSSFSPGGELFKMLNGFDQALGYLGMTLAVLSALYGTFPKQTTRGGRIIMVGICAVFSTTCLIAMALLGFWISIGDVYKLTALWDNYAYVCIGLLVLAMLIISGHSRFGRSTVFGSCCNKLRIVVLTAVILFYSRNYTQFRTIVGNTVGFGSVLTIGIPALVAKAINVSARLVTDADNSLPLSAGLMLTFLCSSYQAFHNRSLLHDFANGASVGYDQRRVVVVALMLSAIDMAAHACGRLSAHILAQRQRRASSPASLPEQLAAGHTLALPTTERDVSGTTVHGNTAGTQRSGDHEESAADDHHDSQLNKVSDWLKATRGGAGLDAHGGEGWGVALEQGLGRGDAATRARNTPRAGAGMSTSAWLRSRRVERLLLAEESQGLAHWCGLISDQVADAFGVVGVTSQVLSAPSYVSPKPETRNHKP